MFWGFLKVSLMSCTFLLQPPASSLPDCRTSVTQHYLCWSNPQGDPQISFYFGGHAHATVLSGTTASNEDLS